MSGQQSPDAQMNALNGRAVVPESIDLEQASPAFRHFYEAYFETIIAARSEQDWDLIRQMRSDELALARRLIRANLRGPQEYRDAAGVLNDRESIPLLHQLLQAAKQLRERIAIARPLWFLERAPVFAELIEQLVRSRQSQLKIECIWEILLLGDEGAIDHLFTMAEDSDPAVRDLALEELTRLSRGWSPASWLSRRKNRRDLDYFRAHRSNRRFIARVLRELARDHTARPIFEPSGTTSNAPGGSVVTG